MMKLVIVDWETDEVLSTIENTSVVPLAGSNQTITTNEGYFDVDMVDINYKLSTIFVHSAEYTLEKLEVE